MQGPEHDSDLLKNGVYGFVRTVCVKLFFGRSFVSSIKYQRLRSICYQLISMLQISNRDL